MSTWFTVLELPFLLSATTLAFLTARAIENKIIRRGMTSIALGSLVMAVAHIIMMSDQLLQKRILADSLGNVGGAWAWLVALCTSWLFYVLSFFWFRKALPKEEIALRLMTRSHDRAVEALRHSEYLYRSVVEAVRDVTYTLSHEGTITSLNPAFEMYTGWSCSEWIGQSFALLVHPEDIPLALERFQQVMAGENPPLFTLRIRERSGDYRVGEFLQTPRLSDGRVVGTLGVGRDVTERVKAGEALRKAHDELELRVQERTVALSEANEELRARTEALEASEQALWETNETLRALFHASPLAIIVMDPDGIVGMWNKAAERIFGWSEQEALGRPNPIVPEARQDEFHALLDGVLHGYSVTLVETERQKKDGSLIEASIAAAPVYGVHEKIRGIMLVCDDITERKQAEEALREREERFRSVTQSTHDAIIVADQQGNIQSWNRGAHIMFGYTETEVLNRPLTLLMPTNYREPHSRAMAGVMHTGESRLAGQTIELMGLRKDGTEFPLELSLAMWKTKAGTFFSGIIRDLTERKREEQTRARLTAMVFEEAERRRIAGELHDQIGQMLTALKLTLEAVGRQPDVTSRCKLELAERSVEELITRVHDLSLDLRPPMLDDLGLVPALLWFVQKYTAQTNVQVSFQHTGLERRFEQEVETVAYRVVQEALTNVARHAKVTGAAVRVWAADSTLWVQIEDKGTGFDLSFKPSTTLGLTGMLERARGLGGDLTVESAPGQGTRVTAELPLELLVKQSKQRKI